MQTQVRLPPSFTSLYRLFLRTSSAAVLHQRRAQINLRKRWRPVFDAGAKVTKELQNCNTDASDASVQEKIEWLRVWNDRSMCHSMSSELSVTDWHNSGQLFAVSL